MECVVSAQPNLFLETVELLYAYINNDPPETLTADGPYCLSVEAVENIRGSAVACEQSFGESIRCVFISMLCRTSKVFFAFFGILFNILTFKVELSEQVFGVVVLFFCRFFQPPQGVFNVFLKMLSV